MAYGSKLLQPYKGATQQAMPSIPSAGDKKEKTPPEELMELKTVSCKSKGLCVGLPSLGGVGEAVYFLTSSITCPIDAFGI